MRNTAAHQPIITRTIHSLIGLTTYNIRFRCRLLPLHNNNSLYNIVRKTLFSRRVTARTPHLTYVISVSNVLKKQGKCLFDEGIYSEILRVRHDILLLCITTLNIILRTRRKCQQTNFASENFWSKHRVYNCICSSNT